MFLRVDVSTVPYSTVMTARSRYLDVNKGARIEISEEVHEGFAYVRFNDDGLAARFRATLNQLEDAKLRGVKEAPADVEWTEDPSEPTRVQIKMQSRSS